ncbi:helix-turn-helix domain-containing protein [Streptomyces sp. NPDC091268]|uniref:helix-turn-helix domain-containing protein n=1 Tax=Streptomyces sp. NPDC091268 TaxID=3365979 RepID=UPI0037FABE1A
MEDKEFGEMLREERRRHGVHPVDIAERAGITPTQLDRIEQGLLHPTAAVRYRLLRALNVLSEEGGDPFGVALRKERLQKGMTLGQLAHRSGVSHAVITKIERGLAQPHEPTRSLLLAALRENRLPPPPEYPPATRVHEVIVGHGRIPTPPTPIPPSGRPDPLLVSTAVDFVEMLGAVHVWSGAMSLRRLEVVSGGSLKRSTTSDALNVEKARTTGKIPPLEWCTTFLRACGIHDLEDWIYAWRRLKALERPAIQKWLHTDR